jgi:hypothetical protein
MSSEKKGEQTAQVCTKEDIRAYLADTIFILFLPLIK